jgi:small-conductance mechanosensitive channel
LSYIHSMQTNLSPFFFPPFFSFLFSPFSVCRTWGPKVEISGSDGRPPVVPDREHMSIGGHIKATLGVLLGWIWFLVIIVLIGVLTHYIDEKVRADMIILGTSFWWWSLFVCVVVFGWYILKMVVSIFFLILKKIKILSFAYYLIAPFKDDVNGIFWVVMLTAVYGTILDGSIPRAQNLDKSANDRIVKVLAALLVVFIILLVKRAILVVLEVALYRKMEPEILEAEVQDQVFGALNKSEDGGADKFLALGGNIDDMLVPPGLLGWIKLVTVADEMRFNGLHAIDNRLPYGDEFRVPEPVLRSEGTITGRLIHSHIAGNNAVFDEERVQEVFGKGPGSSIYEQLSRHSDTEGGVSLSDCTESCEELFVRRASFQRMLEGRQLLVQVSNDLLTVLAVFICALVILDAFDIDTSSIMGPNLLVIGCLTFIFAPFLRDFVSSMYLIFFIRPYDLGDYITVDAGQFPGEELLVKRTRVMVTHFRNAAGEKVYISNAIIANSKIHNLSRLKRNRNKYLRQANKRA